MTVEMAIHCFLAGMAPGLLLGLLRTLLIYGRK